jgi:hypothetical protein
LGASQSNKTRIAVIVIANLVSLVSLWWTLRDAELDQLSSDLASINWWWVGVAIAGQVSAYFLQSLRWRLILAPVATLPFMQGVRAIFTGLFASELLPLRAGEVLRCYMVSRWTDLPFSVSVSSVVIERIFDGLMMWLGLKAVLQTGVLPKGFGYLTDSLGVFIAIGTVVLLLALYGPRPEAADIPPGGWRRRFAILRTDLTLIGRSWHLGAALLLTIPFLAVQAIPLWVLYREYDFDLPLGAAVSLMLILRLAAALPQAPATLGLYQLLTKEFLERGYGIPPGEAARFSLVLWAVVKLPLLAAGAMSLMVTGVKFGDLRTQAAKTAEELDQAHRQPSAS